MEELEAKHRKEKKELQAQIQALKKVAKNDKSKKKELLADIAKLEIDLENQHKQEIEDILTSPEINKPVEESTSDTEISEVKKKISKAQKRRDKKVSKEKEREIQIKLQEKQNINGPRNIEIQAIVKKLNEYNLCLHNIPSDGDCLYRAISHQLEILRNKQISVDELRKAVSNHIRLNEADFLPFMCNPETYDILTDTEFNEYCDKIINSKVWGGQLEIRALSNSLKCPIRVIQATSPDTIDQGLDFDGSPLIVTYHRHMYSLGEHYNSTKPVNNDDVL